MAEEAEHLYFGDSLEAKMDFQVGDIITMKKVHPCGSQEWEILRVGADFRLKCRGCGRIIMLSRTKVTPLVRKLQRTAENSGGK